LSDEDRRKRVECCNTLKKDYYDKHPTFLYRIVACDEKWVYLSNPRRHERAWVDEGDAPPPMVKRDLHSNRRMLCLWFDATGVIYWELLPKGSSINSEFYCTQLESVQQALRELRSNSKGIFLLQDNATPHKATQSIRKIQGLGWTLLPHPPYSPDLNPCDYGINRSIDDALEGKKFKNQEELQEFLNAHFDSQEERWYAKQFEQLRCRWAEVVEEDGNYFYEGRIKKKLEEDVERMRRMKKGIKL
jgi:[histone H3]-lysine36 N-dimethyltransferase SETMAR